MAERPSREWPFHPEDGQTVANPTGKLLPPSLIPSGAYLAVTIARLRSVSSRPIQ